MLYSDIRNLQFLSLELIDNGGQAKEYFSLGLDGIQKTSNTLASFTSMVLSFVKAGDYMVKSGYCSGYRLRTESAGSKTVLCDSGQISMLQVADTSSNDEELEISLNRFGTLSLREKQILCFHAKGCKIEESCQMLCITKSTYTKHRKNLQKKLHIHSPLEFGAWCEKYLELCFKQNVNNF